MEADKTLSGDIDTILERASQAETAMDSQGWGGGWDRIKVDAYKQTIANKESPTQDRTAVKKAEESSRVPGPKPSPVPGSPSREEKADESFAYIGFSLNIQISMARWGVKRFVIISRLAEYSGQLVGQIKVLVVGRMAS